MSPNLYAMLESLAATMPSMMNLATVFAYIIGLTLIIGALYKLRTFGDFRVMMFQGVDLKGPLGAIIFGSFLVWLPSTLDITAATFWGVSEPIGYQAIGGSVLDEGIAVCMEVIRFVGLVAFIRGLIMLSRLGQQSAQPGTMAKALTHIVAGICAYHVGATIDVISNTLSI